MPLEYTNVKKKEKKSDQSLGKELTLPVYGVKLQKHPKAHDVNFTVNFHIYFIHLNKYKYTTMLWARQNTSLLSTVLCGN